MQYVLISQEVLIVLVILDIQEMEQVVRVKFQFGHLIVLSFFKKKKNDHRC